MTTLVAYNYQLPRYLDMRVRVDDLSDHDLDMRHCSIITNQVFEQAPVLTHTSLSASANLKHPHIAYPSMLEITAY